MERAPADLEATTAADAALRPLGWEWHSDFAIDRLCWVFVAIPTEAWREFSRDIDPMDMRQDARVEHWIKEHGVTFDVEARRGGTEYVEGLRLLVKRALEKANA